MSKSREQLNDYLKKININDMFVLDLGVQDKPSSRMCPGKPKEYYTMDIDNQWSPDIVGDLNEEISTWDLSKTLERHYNWPIGGSDFDVIFCIETLEHCWNPVQAVKNIYHLLKKGGTSYISTPFINPHHDTHDYLRYTNEWYRDVLPKVGFSEVKIHERVATIGMPMLKSFYQLEGLRVSKIRPEYGKYTYPIGYFVEAIK